ncbi:MAG: hypothetical protein LIO49_02285 [Ruminococcus sp.]|nr:hypothetical protein [Ruminococcus sp.]
MKKKKSKKFIVGVVLIVIGVIGLLGIFTETESIGSLIGGSLVFIAIGVALLILDKKFPAPEKSADSVAKKIKEPEAIVYITDTGNKFHCDPHCNGMRHAKSVKMSKAKEKGYTACYHCYKD